MSDNYEPNYGCPEMGGFEPAGGLPGAPEIGSQRWTNPMIEPQSLTSRNLELFGLNSGNTPLEPLGREPEGWSAYGRDMQDNYNKDYEWRHNFNTLPPVPTFPTPQFNPPSVPHIQPSSNFHFDPPDIPSETPIEEPKEESSSGGGALGEVFDALNKTFNPFEWFK